MRKIQLFIILAIIASACEKKPENLELVLPVVTTDTANSINAVLQRSSFHLFAQALQRSGMDTALHIQNPFTVFAPTDAALIKAGFTAEKIGTLPQDSLARLVGYHIVKGSYSPNALSLLKGNIMTYTLSRYRRFDPGSGYLIFSLFLLLDKKGPLYLNGNPVNKSDDSTINATNGYIYLIDTVLLPPTKTVYEIIKSRPELNALYTACRTSDSVYFSQGNYDMSFSDSALLSAIQFDNLLGMGWPIRPMTVFAPVNSAFKASPINTPEKLQECASLMLEDGSNRLLLDAIIRGQVGAANIFYENIYLRSGSYIGPPLCYNDFFEITDPNSNGMNTTARPFIGSAWDGNMKYFYLKYIPGNGRLGIKWGDNFEYGPSYVIPSGKNIMALNGVIHEVDSVFYLTK